MCAYYFASVFKNCLLRRNVSEIFVRQSSKTLLGDKIGTKPQNTLIGRLLLYLDKNVSKQYQDVSENNTIDRIIKGDVRILQTLNVNEITNLFYNMSTTNINCNKQRFQKALNALDIECTLRLNSMDLKTALKVLGGFMHIIPNRITEYNFYKCLTNSISIDQHVKSASKQELIQMIFYLGLEKKSRKIQEEVRKCLNRINKEFLEKLTIEEMCILCNSSYRTRTKINEISILDKVKQTLQENLFLMKDTDLLITLVKTIRRNHCQDDDLLSTIACTIFFNKTVQYYNFAAMCHILTLFADYLYYDKELLDLFVNKCLKELQENDVIPRSAHVKDAMRAKDLTTFLWVLSVLDYTNIDHDTIKNLVIPKIKKNIINGEYKKVPDQLLDSILHMWVIGYRAKELFSYIVFKEDATYFKGNPQAKARFNLLITCIKYEDPSLFESLKLKSDKVSNYNASAQVQNRPVLQKVFDNLKIISDDLGIDRFELESQIPHLNIVGVSGYKNKIKAVNVEVLDEYTCLKNKDSYPSGLMNLKLRVLENLNVPVVTITQQDIEELDDLELRKCLTDEINMFCEN